MLAQVVSIHDRFYSPKDREGREIVDTLIQPFRRAGGRDPRSLFYNPVVWRRMAPSTLFYNPALKMMAPSTMVQCGPR